MAENADNSINPEMWLIVPFSWGVAVSLGLVATDWIPLIDAGQTLASPGNIEITLGRTVSMVCLLIVFFNREVGFRSTSFIDAWTVYVTLGLIMAPPLYPALASTIASGPAAFFTFTVTCIGFSIVSFLN